MTDIALAGLVGLYAWVFLTQLHTPGFGWLQKRARRGKITALTGCPYCFGWWAALVLTLMLQWNHLDWVITPLTAFAAAGLIGLLGANLTPGADIEDDDE